MMAAMTLSDVYHALDEGERQRALRYLELVLEENPSADAWFLAAELALDADRGQSVENLRQALALDPAHADSLALLEQLNAGKDVAFTDIAQEPGWQNNQASSSRARAIAASLAAVVCALAVVVLLSKTVSPDVTADAPPESPAAQANLYQPDEIFSLFTASSLPLSDVEQRNVPGAGKRVLNFSVPDADNHGPYPVRVIVYESTRALDRDRETYQTLAQTSEIHVTSNVLFAYAKSLRGEAVERQMLYLFESISGQ